MSVSPLQKLKSLAVPIQPTPPPPAQVPAQTAQPLGYSSKSTFTPSQAPLPAEAQPAQGLVAKLTQVGGDLVSKSAALVQKSAGLVRSTGLLKWGTAQLQNVKAAIAYNQLSEPQKAEYDQVQGALAKDGDVEGQKKLQQLLIDGTLTQTDPSDPGNSKTVLDYMADMTAPGAKTCDQIQGPWVTTGTSSSRGPAPTPTDVLEQSIRDLSDPDAMAQGDGNTLCGPVSVMQQGAGQNPARYMHITSALTLDGKIDEPVQMKLQPNFQVDPDRSLTQQIVGVALEDPTGSSLVMTNNDGTGVVQSQMRKFIDVNTQDMEGGQAVYDQMTANRYGVDVNRAIQMQQMMVGGTYQGEAVSKDDPNSVSTGKAVLEDQLAHGQSVEVEFAPPEGRGKGEGHWVRVTGYDPNTHQVTYVDNGKTYQQDIDTFFGGTQGQGSGPGEPPPHGDVEVFTVNTSIDGAMKVPSEYVATGSDPGGGMIPSAGAKPAQPSGGTSST